VEQFIAKHAEHDIGTLSGFDRLVFRGTLRMLAHRGGMMSYLPHVGVLLKDLKRDIREVAPRPMRITEEP
jgi:hypothetical protein